MDQRPLALAVFRRGQQRIDRVRRLSRLRLTLLSQVTDNDGRSSLRMASMLVGLEESSKLP